MTDPFSPVLVALSAYRFVAHDEHRLYEGLSLAFTSAGLVFERERVLAFPDRKTGRLDYYVPSTGLAIEVKVQGASATILRQIARYASHPDVAGVLLVTTLARLMLAPTHLSNKPVRSYRITGPFG